VTSTVRGSAGVTSWTSPVMDTTARAVAVPGSSRACAARPFEITPPVDSRVLARSTDDAACDPTHTSTSPGSTTRTIRRSENANRVAGTANVTRHEAPGARSTRV